MKKIFLALALVLAVLAACNPPQSTTGTSSDSTTIKSDTSGAIIDTAGATQSDTSRRDTSMHK